MTSRPRRSATRPTTAERVGWHDPHNVAIAYRSEWRWESGVTMLHMLTGHLGILG